MFIVYKENKTNPEKTLGLPGDTTCLNVNKGFNSPTNTGTLIYFFFFFVKISFIFSSKSPL